MRALPQVEVNQVLVGNARFLGQALEVLDHVRSQPERHLFLQTLRVRVLPPRHLRKVMFFLHNYIILPIALSVNQSFEK
jgi:hypothetical protein